MVMACLSVAFRARPFMDFIDGKLGLVTWMSVSLVGRLSFPELVGAADHVQGIKSGGLVIENEDAEA